MSKCLQKEISQDTHKKENKGHVYEEQQFFLRIIAEGEHQKRRGGAQGKSLF